MSYNENRLRARNGSTHDYTMYNINLQNYKINYRHFIQKIKYIRKEKYK